MSSPSPCQSHSMRIDNMEREKDCCMEIMGIILRESERE